MKMGAAGAHFEQPEMLLEQDSTRSTSGRPADDTTVVDERVREIEAALFEFWTRLGRWRLGRLVEHGGTLRFETPIAKLPYNGVIRSHVREDPDVTIAEVLGSFRQRHVQCMWVVHPSSEPADLPQRLASQGLSLVERVTGMSLDLDTWKLPPARTGVRYEEVLGGEALDAYEALIATYWELPDEARPLVAELNRTWTREHGVHRWVAYDGAQAVGKGLLLVEGDLASIFGMSVRPEARGKGVATGLTSTLTERARELGCRRVVLHSSEMAIGVYRRAGFEDRCEILVFGTEPLWRNRDR